MEDHNKDSKSGWGSKCRGVCWDLKPPWSMDDWRELEIIVRPTLQIWFERVNLFIQAFSCLKEFQP